MKNESDNVFERFITEADKYKDMWNTVEMKIVAIKKDNDTYYVMGMSLTILANSTPMSETLLNLEDIIMLHEVRSISHNELSNIIKNLENGILQFGKKELKLLEFHKFEFDRRHSHDRPRLDQDWELPYFWIRGFGEKSVGELINEEEINIELNKWGYKDLKSACRENLGFRIGDAFPPVIFILAPIYLIVDAEIKENKLIFSVKSHNSLNIGDVGISYGIEGDMAKHDRLSFTSKDIISKQENFNELQKIIDLPPGTIFIIFWTYYKDEKININTIHKPIEKIEKIEEINPKWIIIDSLFSRREKRGELIGGKRIFERYLGIETEVSDSRTFELIILNLMSIVGFHVIFTGKRIGYKGVDMLAFSPDSLDVIVISCTITNNIGEKIRTLLPQINKIKRQLENYKLIPAIFSPINLENIIGSDVRDANEKNVALLLSHEIRDIYQAIQITPVSKIKDSVLNFIESRMTRPPKL